MPQLEPGHLVILSHAPADLLQGLPADDQAAIVAIVGKPVTLAGYSFGQAEVEFIDSAGDSHSIWVEPAILRAA